MKSLIRWAMEAGPAMNILQVGILALGFLSLYLMRRELFPEFELDIVLVSVPYPGASPSEVEDGIVQKIEEACRGIDGIKKQTAVAREGAGFLVLECQEGGDVQRILDDVRAAVDRIPSFPEMAEDPEIQQIIFREPAIRVGVVEAFERTPDMDPLELELKLRSVAESVRDELLQLPAVSQAIVVGSRDYQIDVEIPQRTLREYDLSLDAVARTIAQENLELPGGAIKTESQEILVRGREKRTLGSELEELMISTNDGSEKVPLGRLARVQDAFVDATAVSAVNGKPALVISIDRSKTEDLIVMAQAVRDYADAKTIPGYRLLYWRDQSVDVQERLDMIIDNGVQGMLMVFIVLALFLDFRLAFWVSLGVPVSIAGAGLVMFGFGQTLNMLTMFSFLIALGIVVDDAIVIGENTYRHRAMGKKPFQAALDAVVEVLPSVSAAVMTTVIAFIPLAFVSGVMGKFIAVMPLAVIAMLLFSLFESAFILPCHLAHVRSWFIAILETALFPFKWMSDRMNPVTARWLDVAVERLYKPLLRLAIAQPLTFVSGSVGLLIVACGFVAGGFVQFVVFPKGDSPVVEATIVYPDGTSGLQTAAAAERLEAAFMRLNEDLVKENAGRPVYDVIHRVAGSAGVSSPGGPAEQLEGSNVGRVSIELRPSSERSVDSTEIEKRWRAIAGEFPGAERLTFSAPQMGPPGGAIEFKLLGESENFAEMERFSEEAQTQLAGYPGVFDVQDDSRVGNWEFQISVKDRAQSLGITLERIAQTVRSAYYGAESKRVQRGRHEVKIMVRLPEDDRTSISQLSELYVRGDDGEQYPISEVADLEVKRGYAEINRLDQKRSITISADLDEHEANAEETIAAFKSQWLDGKLKDHPRLSVNWEGQAEQTRESMNSLFRGFVVSMAAIYFLLALQFRSYFQPFMIMFVIPFGLIGAIGGHFAMGLDITLFSMFGLVALTGVVVNDSIVLVEFINQQIEEGIPLKRALLDASGTRFRPIMLTGITTVVGLFPMLLETSFQAQFLIPMATSICFGLMMTAPLAIFQVPVFYLLYAKAMMPGYPIEESDPPYRRLDDDHGDVPHASGGGTLVGAHVPELGGGS